MSLLQPQIEAHWLGLYFKAKGEDRRGVRVESNDTAGTEELLEVPDSLLKNACGCALSSPSAVRGHSSALLLPVLVSKTSFEMVSRVTAGAGW